MATFNEIQDATIVIGAAGLAGTGVSASQLSDILNRIQTLEALASPPIQIVLSSRWYGPMTTLVGFTAPTAFTLTSNRLYAAPIYIPQPATFGNPGLTVTTAVTGATVHLGIYGLSSRGLPGSLVANFGTIDAGLTGFRSNASSVTLARGLYWIAAVTATVGVAIETITSPLGMTALIGNLNTAGTGPRAGVFRSVDLAAGFTALPDPFGSITTLANIPALWLQAA